MVKKIFTTLIIVVALVIVGAFTLNILLPNTTAYLAGSIEQSIQNATGFQWDINGDGQVGPPNQAIQSGTNDESYTGANVNGFN